MTRAMGDRVRSQERSQPMRNFKSPRGWMNGWVGGWMVKPTRWGIIGLLMDRKMRLWMQMLFVWTGKQTGKLEMLCTWMSDGL